jgi:NADPH:quinone reductase-like Zn-dependent oxidoreductase
MKALVITGTGQAEVREVPIPSVRPDYVQIKVLSFGLNPGE